MHKFDCLSNGAWKKGNVLKFGGRWGYVTEDSTFTSNEYSGTQTTTIKLLSKWAIIRWIQIKFLKYA